MNKKLLIGVIIIIITVAGIGYYLSMTERMNHLVQWVNIDPVQCLGNDWEQDWLKNHDMSYKDYPKESEKQIIKDYYERQGIAIYGIEIQDTYGGVCEACSCPRGDTVYLLVSIRDVGRMVKEFRFGTKWIPATGGVPFTEEERESVAVVMFVDKKEYEEGEAVGVILRNTRNDSAYYPLDSCCNLDADLELQKYEDGRWIETQKEREFLACHTGPCIGCLPLEGRSEKSLKVDLRFEPSVRYRFKLNFGTKCEEGIDFGGSISEVYSNEFTIK